MKKSSLHRTIPSLVTMSVVALFSIGQRNDLPAADVPKTNNLLEIHWKQLKDSGLLKSGEIVTDEKTQRSVLKIESPLKGASPGGVPTVVPLFEIEAPKVEKRVYVLSGDVRYEHVEGTGYLEMWSLFADGSHFFTRTLGSSGTMQSLQATSDWRPMQLPFQLAEAPKSQRPNRLVMNVAFQGPGTVWLSDLSLAEFDTLQQATTAPGAWWADTTAGWIGGIGGTLLGLIGALVGVLVSRGVARKFVLGGTATAIALGIALLCTGIVATILRQPYGVFYPLLLGGGLCLALGIVGLIGAYQRYSHLELRRMEALDAER